ncbi:hypothetical protein NDU88_002102 [Pleurodeles waltl]|uniref:Uncharacterized protein n=1 Tax=Pleurodeles waltl TaxID=8319 RepID=A0AAV7UW03_PLEWA|nr:hypothetical protein NDU88_002102 [Pleurodeles waltl]
MGSTCLPESIDEVGLEDFGYDPVLVTQSHSASKRWTALMIGLVQRIGWARKYLRPKALVCVSVLSRRVGDLIKLLSANHGQKAVED